MRLFCACALVTEGNMHEWGVNIQQVKLKSQKANADYFSIQHLYDSKLITTT